MSSSVKKGWVRTLYVHADWAIVPRSPAGEVVAADVAYVSLVAETS